MYVYISPQYMQNLPNICTVPPNTSTKLIKGCYTCIMGGCIRVLYNTAPQYIQNFPYTYTVPPLIHLIHLEHFPYIQHAHKNTTNPVKLCIYTYMCAHTHRV
ncbi:hypothetical protein GDO81_007224 [Engystomops pustulosus]|uniref:Uncharacterized protein n=1 Tax=Engystomops pustulosus TaxID=76066 RepID=A0AAV7C5N8_ENGPU|nr:hypothetical protein GDO81_007224 [Engystomops pustulosus]